MAEIIRREDNQALKIIIDAGNLVLGKDAAETTLSIVEKFPAKALSIFSDSVVMEQSDVLQDE